MSQHEVRYLNYWWDRKSTIDPKHVENEYYTVFYDHKGRRVKIETYSKDGEIIHYHHHHWKGSWLIQTKRYSSDHVLSYTTTYHYNNFGFLIDEKVYSRGGRLLGRGLHHERDIIDSLNQWLSDLIAFPVIEATGLINGIKSLFVNRKRG